ncbi:hypothetical protein ABZP36_003483 [Zizania latifolia]
MDVVEDVQRPLLVGNYVKEIGQRLHIKWEKEKRGQIGTDLPPKSLEKFAGISREFRVVLRNVGRPLLPMCAKASTRCLSLSKKRSWSSLATRTRRFLSWNPRPAMSTTSPTPEPPSPSARACSQPTARYCSWPTARSCSWATTSSS